MPRARHAGASSATAVRILMTALSIKFFCLDMYGVDQTNGSENNGIRLVKRSELEGVRRPARQECQEQQQQQQAAQAPHGEAVAVLHLRSSQCCLRRRENREQAEAALGSARWLSARG